MFVQNMCRWWLCSVDNNVCTLETSISNIYKLFSLKIINRIRQTATTTVYTTLYIPKPHTLSES